MPTPKAVTRRIVRFIAVAAVTAIVVRPLIEAGLDAWDRHSATKKGG